MADKLHAAIMRAEVSDLYVSTGWTGWLITGRSLPEAPGRDHS